MKLRLIPPWWTKSPEKWGFGFYAFVLKTSLKTHEMFNIHNKRLWDTGSLLPKLMPPKEDIHIVYMCISGYLSDTIWNIYFWIFLHWKKHTARFTSLPTLTKAAQSVCGEHWAPDTDSCWHVAGSHVHNMARKHLDIMLRGPRNVMSTRSSERRELKRQMLTTPAPTTLPPRKDLPPYFIPTVNFTVYLTSQRK